MKLNLPVSSCDCHRPDPLRAASVLVTAGVTVAESDAAVTPAPGRAPDRANLSSPGRLQVELEAVKAAAAPRGSGPAGIAGAGPGPGCQVDPGRSNGRFAAVAAAASGQVPVRHPAPAAAGIISDDRFKLESPCRVSGRDDHRWPRGT